MLSSQEDPVKARIIEAELALETVADLLEVAPSELAAGSRTQAEAFVANAPPLWGYDRDTERLFLALDIAISAIETDPTYAGGYALAAACLYRMGMRDTDIYDPRALIAAIPWANRAILIHPEYDAGWEIYVEIHCYKGDFKTAESALGRVLKRFGDGDVYARCAFLFFRMKGEIDQAKNWGALAWQTEWDSARLVRTLLALGQLYREGKEWAKALDCYRVVTEKDHNNAWGWHFFAVCTATLGNAERALELNQRAVELGKLHEFRAYQEELRKQAGREKLSAPKMAAYGALPRAPGDTTRRRMRPPSSSAPVVTAPAPAPVKTVVTPPPAAKTPPTVATPPAVRALPRGKPDTSRQVRLPPPRRRSQG